MSPNWGPAFAGVNSSFDLALFSREGGSPDWVPAFAGKQATCDYCVDFSTASPALSAALPTLFAADVIAASLLFCAPSRLNR